MLNSPNNPQAVLILVSIPAQGKRLERHFLTTNTLFDISKWVTRELNDGQDNDDGHVFFTNFPKREWKLSDVLQNLPIERKKLLLLVE